MIGPLLGAAVLPHPGLGFAAIALLCLLAAGLMRGHANPGGRPRALSSAR